MGGHRTHQDHHPMDSSHQWDTSPHHMDQNMSRHSSNHHINNHHTSRHSSNHHISSHNMVCHLCKIIHRHSHPKSRCAGSGLRSVSSVALSFLVALVVQLPAYSASVSSQKR